MSKQTEQELAKLLKQCESALHVYADKTGASVFAEALNEPISSRTGAVKALSDKALASMAKGLEGSTADANERMAKLEAKLAAKANDLEELKLQREALALEQEQERQAGLENKRQAMFRGGKKKPIGQPGAAEATTSETNAEAIISGERIVLGKMKFGSRRR